MRFAPALRLLICLASGLKISSAQMPFISGGKEIPRFQTSAQAAAALDGARDLQAYVNILPDVTAAYLGAHDYKSLLATISNLKAPEGAGRQQTFLLADLHAITGDSGEASRLLKQIPEESLKDPTVLRFRIDHPDLFGDDPLFPPPGLDSEPPLELIGSYLDILEPDKAWQVIAAHPDVLLDHLDALHTLTAQIANENVVSRVLPLLEQRAQRETQSWEWQLTLAQYQLLAGNTAAATETYRQVYRWKPRAPSTAPTPAERLSALRGLSVYELIKIGGTGVWPRIKTLENARDVVLICLARLADERHEGAQFIHDLEAEYRGDEIGWITALMIIESPGLVVRELRAALAEGPPPGLAALAIPWLRASHRGDIGGDSSEQDRVLLANAFVRLFPAEAPTTGSPDPTTPGTKEWADLLETFKNHDPALQERLLSELPTSTDFVTNGRIFSVLMQRVSHNPQNAFNARGASIMLAKAIEETDGNIGSNALGRKGSWSLPMPVDHGLPHRQYVYRPSDKDSRPTSEQVEATFLGQSALPWEGFYPLSQDPTGGLQPGGPPEKRPFPPELAACLETMANDASSPLHISARIAEAYVLHDVTGQEDHALELLQQSIKESPSYVARFWLTAFLARRQQFKEAAAVFAGVQSVPGYFEDYLQGGRALLQRADKGEPLFEKTHPVAIAEPAKRKRSPSDLLADLQQVNAASNDPATSTRLLAIATKLFRIFPIDAPFFGRGIVLRTLATLGQLEPQIVQMQKDAEALPRSPDAQLALGDALGLSTAPQSAEKSAAAYRKAFQLAPDRLDVAAKITGPRFSVREKEDAYCVLLRRSPTADWRRQPEASLFLEPEALARYIRAYGEGIGRLSRQMIASIADLRHSIAKWREAGQDDAVIDLLTSINRQAPLRLEADAEWERLLISMLAEKGRSAEVVAVVDRMLFPSECLYGLDIDYHRVLSLSSPAILDAIRRVETLGQTEGLKTHARQIIAEHPGDNRAPLALLTLLIMDRSPALGAELPAIFNALHNSQQSPPINELSELARMASIRPESKSVVSDLFAEILHLQAGLPSELATIEKIAATAMEMGDQERAREALRELVKAAPKSPLPLPEWTANLVLMARAGLGAEAEELSQTVFNQKNADSQRGNKPACRYVLDYMSACLQFGQPEMGRKALTDFQRLASTEAEDPYRFGSADREFHRKFTHQAVETLVTLGCTDAAVKILQTLRGSRAAAASPEFRGSLDDAQRFLAQGTGGAGATPAAFLEGDPEKEIALWWTVSAIKEEGTSQGLNGLAVFATDLPALAGRYSVEILGGESSSKLTRLAMIPNAPSRGGWKDSLKTTAKTLRYLRVILTDAAGVTVIGPALPVAPGEEKLGDPEMSEVLKAGTSSKQWTAPDGVLTTAPGPIPGHPALTFVRHAQNDVSEFRGARIPIHPNESFVQSAWLRGADGSRWGVRCFDSQGKELGDFENASLGAPGEVTGWTFTEHRFYCAPPTPANLNLHRGQVLPSGAAFIEPVLKIFADGDAREEGMPVSWAGLSLRSIPPADQAPALPPEKESDRPGPPDPPAPSPSATQATADRTETIFAEFPQPALKVAVSPEGDRAVVGCADGTLHFLEYPSGKELAAVHAHDDAIVNITVLPKGAGVYSVDSRGDTHFVSINPAKDELVACTSHPFFRVLVAPIRRWIIFASNEGSNSGRSAKTRVQIDDLATGKPVHQLEEEDHSVELFLSADEKVLSVVSSKGRENLLIRSWELPSFNRLPDRLDTRTERATLKAATMTHSLFRDPPRNRYVEWGNFGDITVRDLEDSIIWSFKPARDATSVALAPKDGAVLVCKEDGKVWRLVSPK